MPVNLDDCLQGLLAAGAQSGSQLTNVLDRNLVQMGGVINETLVQQHGGVADDAAQMAAMRTLIQVPKADA